jgi:chemotaxis protein histidine kinase CheA
MPLSADDQKKYKDLYIQTAKPYIADLQKISTLDTADTATLEVIHRAAHSLGSQSLMMEYNSLGNLSRLIEKICKSTLDGEYTLNDEVRDAITKAVNRMDVSVNAIEEKGEELDLSADADELHAVSKITL